MAILTNNLYLDLFTFVVSLITVIITYFKWKFGYWSSRGVITPPTTIPFGNTKGLFLQKVSYGDAFKDAYNNFKSKGFKYCGYYFLSTPTLILLDPELIKTIMTKDFLHFTDHMNYVNEDTDPLSAHLFSLKGLKWKNLRTKLTPTFTSGKMKMMFQTLADCSDELVAVMDDMVKKEESIDIKDIVGRFTTDVIGTCAFGIECNSLRNPDSEFRKYGKRFLEEDFVDNLISFMSVTFPSVLDLFRIPITNKDVSKFFMNIVKETVNYREINNVVRKDFMHLLIQLKNNIKIKDEDAVGQLQTTTDVNKKDPESDVGKSLTIEELAAQAFVFFLAGFETSSTTLTFCFYELVSNTEIQDKLREEINSVLEKHENKLTYNAIMEMTYMDKCINETLRKYPPLPVLTRECTQSYNLPNSNVIVEKGTGISIPILGIQRDSEYYPEPEKFDPERFSPENKSQRHPYTWLPFGEGPRVCIGLRFGMMQTKVALTTLLRNFKFTINSKTQQPLKLDPKSVIMTVDGGVWLNAKKIVE